MPEPTAPPGVQPPASPALPGAPPFAAIQDHGVIGDLRTVALVSVHGDLDWLCWPRFDSPSVFAALLDPEKGGHFLLRGTCADTVCRQRYWAETNVLVTRFYSSEGVGEVVDFMTVEEEGRTLDGPRRIIRQVRCARGRVEFELVCQPAFDYARERHALQLDARGALFSTPSLSLRLSSPVPLQGHDDGSVHARFWLEEGHDLTFTLQAPERPDLDRHEARVHFQQTIAYWRHWLSHCTYRGRWRELVHRSALALKLLIYAPTGAIVAAPTASLPEFLGGTRNWDYRYTWIRDAAFTLYALMRIGFTREAGAFMRWLQERIEEGDQDGSLPLMYRIDGRRDLHEEVLTHLSGYRGSRPVRVGNDAMPQLQLDIYGELMDSVYLYNKYGEPISDAFWCHLRRTLNWVCDHWNQPDQGIWEVRGPRQHFVYSKLMCWVALDRGLRLAEKRSFPAERHRWLEVRDTIYEEIIARGWNEDRQAFSQAYGSDSLDASNLIMPLVFFMSPTDPRMLATLDAVGAPTRKGGLAADGLLYRYDAEVTQDGLAAENEGTFNICSFWLIEAQTRAGKNQRHRLERARHLFERLQGYANHLGLFAEQIGPRGEALGNFPQALTHLSLISAAYNLDRALGERD